MIVTLAAGVVVGIVGFVLVLLAGYIFLKFYDLGDARGPDGDEDVVSDPERNTAMTDGGPNGTEFINALAIIIQTVTQLNGS